MMELNWRQTLGHSLRREVEAQDHDRQGAKPISDKAEEFFKAFYRRFKIDVDVVNSTAAKGTISVGAMNTDRSEFGVELQRADAACVTIRMDRNVPAIHVVPENSGFFVEYDRLSLALRESRSAKMGIAAIHNESERDVIAVSRLILLWLVNGTTSN